MGLYINRKIDFQHNDYRGSLTQLVHDGFKQINVLESKKGVERGSHFHKKSVEAFYLISGSVEVQFSSSDCKEKTIFGTGDFFEIQPFILHNMVFLEDCIMVQMYDIPVENPDGTKDIYMEDEFYERSN